MTNKKILNDETLKNWQKIDPENWQLLVQELIKLFSTVGREQYLELQSKWENNDRQGLCRIAHSLKSSCGNIGAELAHEKLDQLEKNAPDLSQSDLNKMLLEFNEIFMMTITEVANYKIKINHAA